MYKQNSTTESNKSYRQNALDFIELQTKIRIKRVVRFKNSSGRYEYVLETARGNVKFNNVAGLLDQRTFRAAMADQIKKCPLRMSSPDFDGVARILVDLCEEAPEGVPNE